ncbi:MAG: L-erythro-3,5-diaminohexanoate dehydrogenase [Deltaproteobacteria bacterium]|nr:L-erythro-3,5-diaminohexanoate dehydrogenase [Deltaproteobacteria bacterium]
MEERKGGNIYGAHRVVSPKGALPQAAYRVDNSLPIFDNEILIDVLTLNVDSASFHQIKEQAGKDPRKVGEIIMATVRERGKQHNPVTGSGGMLIGTVAQIGSNYHGRLKLEPGDRVATLVSLSLTPLLIDEIKAVHMESEQVDISGKAVLFESGVAAKLPSDMPEKVALAALDVAGAPAQTAQLVKPGQTVLVIGGGGKSGTLCLYVARKKAGKKGKVIGFAHSDASFLRMKDLGFADICLQGTATNPLEVYEKVLAATGGELADIVINCANIPGTELASILPAKQDGLVYFFSMATSFTAAALGAEGIGHGATMLIGNGYCPAHDEYTLEVLRESPALMKFFTETYGK